MLTLLYIYVKGFKRFKYPYKVNHRHIVKASMRSVINRIAINSTSSCTETCRNIKFGFTIKNHLKYACLDGQTYFPRDTRYGTATHYAHIILYKSHPHITSDRKCL